MYKYAVEDNLALENIAQNIVTNIDNLQKQEKRVLTRQETARFLDIIKSERHKNMFTLA